MILFPLFAAAWLANASAGAESATCHGAPDAWLAPEASFEPGCAEWAFERSRDPDLRQRLSAALIAHATEPDRWASLVERHLDSIGPDPALAAQYAWYLANTGDDALESAIKWASVALEADPSLALPMHRLRAEAAVRAWKIAAGRSSRDQSRAALDELKQRAKRYARDWMLACSASGKDPDAALVLCTEVGGDVGCPLDEGQAP